MTTATSPLAGAATIFRQLGGNQFAAMTGARNFVYSNSPVSLWCQIGRNAAGIGKLLVTLQSDDTYRVAFFARAAVRPLKVLFGIHADGLRHAFETETGLRTSL